MFEGNSQDVLKIDYKKRIDRKIWEDQGTELAGDFKTLCTAEGLRIYSTMGETKAAFAERTLRSLKKLFYCYMGEYGYKYIQKFPQFMATLNSSNYRTKDMKPNRVNNSDFMLILYSKQLRE